MHKKIILKFSALFFGILSLGSCTSDCSDQIDTSKISLDYKVIHLEKEFSKVKNQHQAQSFLNSHPLFHAFHTQAGIPIEVLKQQLIWLGNPNLDSLKLDVEKQFGNFDAQKTELDMLFKNTKYYFPSFKAPEVNTMVSGFGDYILNDADSLMLIGLDYFLDSTARYQPHREEMPDYIKRTLTPHTIDTKAAFALSNRFLQNASDQRLINQMITFGKQYYYMHKVLPCKPENELFDYSFDDWAEIQSNQFTIYSYFTKNELFYNTRGENIRLFLTDRPNCVEIGDKCPGRIGRWLGYEIVKAYVEKTGISLQDLLADTDHVKIFTQSGYKPKK